MILEIKVKNGETDETLKKNKLEYETMKENRIKRFNENSELNISDVRGSKLNIHDFMKQISIEDIKKSIEDNLHYQETGKRLFDKTIQDEIYEQYFSKLGESKSTMMFESYDIICRELSKRWFLGNV